MGLRGLKTDSNAQREQKIFLRFFAWTGLLLGLLIGLTGCVKDKANIKEETEYQRPPWLQTLNVENQFKLESEIDKLSTDIYQDQELICHRVGLIQSIIQSMVELSKNANDQKLTQSGQDFTRRGDGLSCYCGRSSDHCAAEEAEDIESLKYRLQRVRDGQETYQSHLAEYESIIPRRNQGEAEENVKEQMHQVLSSDVIPQIDGITTSSENPVSICQKIGEIQGLVGHVQTQSSNTNKSIVADSINVAEEAGKLPCYCSSLASSSCEGFSTGDSGTLDNLLNQLRTSVYHLMGIIKS